MSPSEDSNWSEKHVTENLCCLSEHTNHKQTVGRNMSIKDIASEELEKNEKHVFRNWKKEDAHYLAAET